MSDFQRRLDEALDNHGLGYMMSVKNFAHQRALKESREQHVGPYYWVPIPAENEKGYKWDLLTFFEDVYGGFVEHMKAWEKEVAPYLAEKWGKSVRALKDLPYGVPRGRVTTTSRSGSLKQYAILHGGDSPTKSDTDLKLIIKRKFGLLEPMIHLDDHEVMQSWDLSGLESVLGIELSDVVRPS